MKTSKLIQALQAIDKTVPFDADVMTFGDIYPRRLARVFHEAPDTFLVFEGDDGPADELDLNALSDEEFNLVIAYRKASEAARHAAEVVLETGKLPDSVKS